MNVIDNLHPISPVGGSLPAGGSAHAGHAYFTSLITPFVTGDFNGVPQPSDYANKMKQPITEAPSVTWKSAGPGKKRLKLVKQRDGSYALAPEDDSFDGFIDYGGDEKKPSPPTKLDVLPPPDDDNPPSLRDSTTSSSLNSLVSGFSSITDISGNDPEYLDFADNIWGIMYPDGRPRLPAGSKRSSVSSLPNLLESSSGSYVESRGSSESSAESRRSSVAHGSKDSLSEHMKKVLQRDSSTSLSPVSETTPLSEISTMLMDQALPKTQAFTEGQVKASSRHSSKTPSLQSSKTPSLQSSTTESTSSSKKSSSKSSSNDNYPVPSSTNTWELLETLKRKIRDITPIGYQETPAHAEAFRNDFRLSDKNQPFEDAMFLVNIHEKAHANATTREAKDFHSSMMNSTLKQAAQASRDRARAHVQHYEFLRRQNMPPRNYAESPETPTKRRKTYKKTTSEDSFKPGSSSSDGS